MSKKGDYTGRGGKLKARVDCGKSDYRFEYVKARS